jgi:hypothetical protein
MEVEQSSAVARKNKKRKLDDDPSYQDLRDEILRAGEHADLLSRKQLLMCDPMLYDEYHKRISMIPNISGEKLQLIRKQRRLISNKEYARKSRGIKKKETADLKALLKRTLEENERLVWKIEQLEANLRFCHNGTPQNEHLCLTTNEVISESPRLDPVVSPQQEYLCIIH